MGVLNMISIKFISRLVKILEDKIYFAQRKYRSTNLIVLPPITVENSYVGFQRIKSLFYYEHGKFSLQPSFEGLMFIFVFPDIAMFTEYIGHQGYDETLLRYLPDDREEVGLLYIGFLAHGIEFSPEDFPHSWEDGSFDTFSTWSDRPTENVRDDIPPPHDSEEDQESEILKRERIDALVYEYTRNNYPPSQESREGLRNMINHAFQLHVSSREGSIVLNGISSFREEECVIYKDTRPDIIFFNCGHIPVCEECYNISNLEGCPLCKTPCQMIRKL